MSDAYIDRVLTVLLLEGSNIGAVHYQRVAEAVVSALGLDSIGVHICHED